VYRNGENGSTPLPTIFGPVLGVTSQGVRATATAISANGNATNCLRPFAFADGWTEAITAGQFNKYVETGPGAGNVLTPTHDDYGPGPGTTIAEFGQRIDFQFNRNLLTDAITHGFLVPLDLGGDFATNITTCNGRTNAIGDVLPVATGGEGALELPGVNAVLAQDPLANWDAINNRVVNSCAPGCGPVSPRLIPIALFNPDQYQHNRATGIWTGCPGGTPCVTVSNIIGLFIHVGATPNPHGHMVRYPGLTSTTAPTYNDNASWLTTTSLIR
jgi:hypothetical protein